MLAGTAGVAQLAEHLTCNENVRGPIPLTGSMKYQYHKTCDNCGNEFCSPHLCAKYCGMKCSATATRKRFDDKVSATGRFPANAHPRTVKRYFTARLGTRCAICGRRTWLGKPILLVLDHIDGNSTNRRVSNCRLVCSNCDAQLPTYKGKNKGKGRHARRIRYQQGNSY